jgi:hypothetical protein
MSAAMRSALGDLTAGEAAAAAPPPPPPSAPLGGVLSPLGAAMARARAGPKARLQR